MKPKSRIEGINVLLCLDRFNPKGQRRLSHLSDQGIAALVTYRPDDETMWPNYAQEIQKLLSKIDITRKQERNQGRSPAMGQPSVSVELATAVCVLAYLKHLSENGFQNLLAMKFRELLTLGAGPTFMQELFKEKLFEIEQDGLFPASTRTISTQTAIQFLELYRDELLELPRIKTKKTFDEFERHEIECGNFNWLDDNGESYLDAIRDMPFETFFDELPKLQPVLDWFVATKPTFDKNQLKRGWMYLEKASDAWHEHNQANYSYGVTISEYPNWECILSKRQENSPAVIPKDSPFEIFPLTTPQQMLEETQAMHHCVVTYIESCIEGTTRIFSVRHAGNGQRFATAEFSRISGEWKLVQLKGKSNLELMHRLYTASDPLAVALQSLVDWYNRNSLIQNETPGREVSTK